MQEKVKENILKELKRQVAFSDDRTLNIEHFFNKICNEVKSYGLKNIAEVSKLNQISLRVVLDIYEFIKKENK